MGTTEEEVVATQEPCLEGVIKGALFMSIRNTRDSLEEFLLHSNGRLKIILRYGSTEYNGDYAHCPSIVVLGTV